MSNSQPNSRTKLLKVALLSFIVVIGFLFYFNQQSMVDNENYRTTILEKRKETDSFMRTSESSPFTDSLLSSYNGLTYFEPDPEYRVQAIINRIEIKEQLIIPTSDSQKQRYEKFAYADFRLKGERHRLLLLKPIGFGPSEVIFTAFADATSGESTYGGGRYLDLKFKNARQITIDFNLAYNPFCAYNATFSCPLPPKENILPIAIEAGEKDYQ